MVLEKNENPVLNLCKVLIRSTDGVANIPQLQRVYHTPSKITYGTTGRPTENGNLFDKSIRISYPGLGTEDFKKFDELIKGSYQVFVEMENGEVYEVAPEQFPMSCTSGFDINRGHELVFSSTSPVRSRYVTTNDPGSGSPDLGEMFDYDFDFNLG